MIGAMLGDSAEGELWLATRWKSTGGDEERLKVERFAGLKGLGDAEEESNARPGRGKRRL